MLGVLLLTLRELRAKWIVVGLFIIATLVWGTMALALQMDVVDGSLAGARLFGQEMSDDDFEDQPASGETALDSLAAPEADTLAMAADSLAPLADSTATNSTATDSTATDSTAAAAAAPEAPGRDPRADIKIESSIPFGAASLLESMVFGAQAFVAGAAYWVGILLALFATGGLVASLQTQGEVDLLLSKPLSRSQILLGRLCGVWIVALGLVAYLIVGVWLVMSLKSGIWNPRFLLAIGVIWAMFAVLYSIVTLVSVTTNSSALALMAVLAVVFCSLILAIPELETQVAAMWRPLVIGFKHMLPRFPAVGVQLVPQLASAQPVGALGAFASSLGIGAFLYALAFWRFSRRDF